MLSPSRESPKQHQGSSWDLTSHTKASLVLWWARSLGCSIRYGQTGTCTPFRKYCSEYSGIEKSNGYCMQLGEVTVKRLSTYFLNFKKSCCMYTILWYFCWRRSRTSISNSTSINKKSSLTKLLYICCSKTLMKNSKSRSSQNCRHCLTKEFWQCFLLFSSSWILW